MVVNTFVVNTTVVVWMLNFPETFLISFAFRVQSEKVIHLKYLKVVCLYSFKTLSEWSSRGVKCMCSKAVEGINSDIRILLFQFSYVLH